MQSMVLIVKFFGSRAGPPAQDKVSSALCCLPPVLYNTLRPPMLLSCNRP